MPLHAKSLPLFSFYAAGLKKISLFAQELALSDSIYRRVFCYGYLKIKSNSLLESLKRSLVDPVR